MGKKRTQEQVLARFRETHGDRHDCSRVVCMNSQRGVGWTTGEEGSPVFGQPVRRLFSQNGESFLDVFVLLPASEMTLTPINLAEIRQQWRGKTYAEMIQHQARRMRSADLLFAVAVEHLQRLPVGLHVLIQAELHRWEARLLDPSFWRRDLVDILDELCAYSRRTWEEIRIYGEPTDEDLFTVFEVFMSTHAGLALEQKGLRKLAGIRLGIFRR